MLRRKKFSFLVFFIVHVIEKQLNDDEKRRESEGVAAGALDLAWSMRRGRPGAREEDERGQERSEKTSAGR